MLLNQKNPHGGDIYRHSALLDFSASINPAGMPDAVRQALMDAAAACNVYPDPYCLALREAIAAAEGLAAVKGAAPADCVLCGNGAAELIYSFAYALPKDRPALIVAPAFLEYAAALAAAGIRADYYLLSERDGFALTPKILDLDFASYGAVFLASPNNPTGLSVEPSLIRALARTGVRLLCDFCFLDLTQRPDRYAIPELIARYPNLAVLNAFTKSYAMAGVRLGYLLCSDPAFLTRMSEKAPCWNVSTLAQRAGCAALSCKEEWLPQSAARIAEERARMRSALASLGIFAYPGEANFLLLHSSYDLAGPLNDRGILVRDCANYQGLGNGYVRIAIRTAPENDRLLAALREILRIPASPDQAVLEERREK